MNSLALADLPRFEKVEAKPEPMTPGQTSLLKLHPILVDRGLIGAGPSANDNSILARALGD